jgi:Fe-S cluster assembly iron-binding protein IscA
MGLALDEPTTSDEKIEVEGFSFVADNEAADLIRSHGSLSIDYVEGLLRRGFKLSLAGQGAC